MPTFLDRYRSGEREQVWAELIALGAKVREEPLYGDALSVARETMNRARGNIELLVAHLKELGYTFAHPEGVFTPPEADISERISVLERQAGPLPLSLRVWCEVVGDVNLMGSHPRLSRYAVMPSAQATAQSYLSLFTQKLGPVAPGTDPLRQSVELSKGLLDDLVKQIRSGAPRSDRTAQAAEMSRKLLEGMRPATQREGPDVASDPLVVEAGIGDDLQDYDCENEEEAEASRTYAMIIAPDAIHKENCSGGGPYQIEFPNPSIDAPLEGDDDYGHFVAYLRTCFRWGGFPGLRMSKNPPVEELAILTKDLLEI